MANTTGNSSSKNASRRHASIANYLWIELVKWSGVARLKYNAINGGAISRNPLLVRLFTFERMSWRWECPTADLERSHKAEKPEKTKKNLNKASNLGSKNLKIPKTRSSTSKEVLDANGKQSVVKASGGHAIPGQSTASSPQAVSRPRPSTSNAATKVINRRDTWNWNSPLTLLRSM